MKSTKHAPSTAAELTPEGHIREIIAFSLGEGSVSDSDLLDRWTSLDCVEAIVCCERDLKIPEIEDEKLLKCMTIGDLVRAVQWNDPQS